MKDIKFFEERLNQLNIKLKQSQIDQFMLYYDMLIEWNGVMNLTAITEYEEVINKHFIDSLSLCKVVDLNEVELRVLDIGTGAGFPGIPLKIAFPNLKIVLIDSLNKRINFLNEVISKLELDNISALHGRAEDFGKNIEFRETFDVCVSRAVSNLATLSEYCMPYVKCGGHFIPYKSSNIGDELQTSMKAIEVLGGEVINVEEFNLPDSDIQRSLVVIRKNQITPKSYPRSAGKPSKEPIM